MLRFNIKLIVCLLMICFVACGKVTVTNIEVIEETIPECIYISEKEELYKQVKIIVSKDDETKEEIFLDETMLSDTEKEKLNSSGLKVINISYKGKETKFSVCVDKKVESTYEIGRKLNVFYKIYYNYSNESSKIICKETVLKGCYTHRQNQVHDLSAETIMKRYDTTLETSYKKPSSNIITTNSVYLQASKEIESKIKTIMSKDVYKYLEDGAEKEDELIVKKNVLRLSDENLLVTELTEFSGGYKEFEKIFSTIKAELRANDYVSNVIAFYFKINNDLNGAYNLDLQLFGTVKETIYPLIGYYNVSGNVLSAYSQTTSVPWDLELDYLYLKVVYKDEDGLMHEFVLKQKVNME